MATSHCRIAGHSRNRRSVRGSLLLPWAGATVAHFSIVLTLILAMTRICLTIRGAAFGADGDAGISRMSSEEQNVVAPQNREADASIAAGALIADDDWLSRMDDEPTVSGAGTAAVLRAIVAEDEREAARQVGIRGGKVFVRRGKVFKALLFYEDYIAKRSRGEESFIPKPQRNADLEIVTRFPNLEVVHLLNGRFDDEGLKYLAHQTRLREIHLWDGPSSSALTRNKSSGSFIGSGLNYLKNLPLLDTLDLSGTEVTDDSLAVLSEFPALRKLDLRSTAIADRGAEKLRRITGLESLRLAGTRISDAGCVALGQINTLRELEIIGSADPQLITDRGLYHLRGLLNLQVLWVASFTDITADGIAWVCQLPKLMTLTIERTRVTRAAIPLLSQAAQLESVWIGDCDVIDDDVELLAAMPHLRTLHVEGAGITDRAAAELAKSRSIIDLDIDHSRISDLGMATLAHYGKLRRLSVQGLGITDRSAVSLSRNSQLTFLLIRGANMTDSAVASLRDLVHLESLTLDEAVVTDASIEDFKKMKALRSLNLAGVRLTSIGEAALRELVPGLLLYRRD